MNGYGCLEHHSHEPSFAARDRMDQNPGIVVTAALKSMGHSAREKHIASRPGHTFLSTVDHSYFPLQYVKCFIFSMMKMVGSFEAGWGCEMNQGICTVLRVVPRQ